MLPLEASRDRANVKWLTLKFSTRWTICESEFACLGILLKMTSPILLPSFLTHWLDSWGPQTLSRIRAAAEACNEKVAWPNFLINGSNGSSALRVGTDCSGLEAPVHALRSMGLLHKHVFSCEINPAPRTMIEANCLPEEAFMDDVIVSSAGAVPFMHLYVAGFSCKPFSMLHNKTKLLEEKEAEIFKAVLRRIGKLRPPCFVLENVKGIQRCMEKVQSMLQDLGYIVAVQLMDPSSLGEPLLRPRFFFIGLRTDVAAFPAGASRHILQHIWTELGQANEPAPLAQRLLPSDHPLVSQHQQGAMVSGSNTGVSNQVTPHEMEGAA